MASKENLSENTEQSKENLRENTERSKENLRENTERSKENLRENTSKSKENLREKTVRSKENLREKTKRSKENLREKTQKSIATEKQKEKLGPYEILSVLGYGNFGNVYEAFDEVNRRRVALKEIPYNEQNKGKVFEEISHMWKVHQHPNILTVYNGLKYRGQYLLIAMELCDTTLDKFLMHRDTHLTEKGILSLFTQCARAIQYIHSKNIVHRDIKPDNILMKLRNGEILAKISDFGISKLAHGGSDTFASVTDTGLDVYFQSPLGMRLFISPEFHRYRDIRRKSLEPQTIILQYHTSVDIYSLGIVYAYVLDFENADNVYVMAMINEEYRFGKSIGEDQYRADLENKDQYKAEMQQQEMPQIIKQDVADTYLILRLKRLTNLMVTLKHKDRPLISDVVVWLNELQESAHGTRRPPRKKNTVKEEGRNYKLLLMILIVAAAIAYQLIAGSTSRPIPVVK